MVAVKPIIWKTAGSFSPLTSGKTVPTVTPALSSLALVQLISSGLRSQDGWGHGVGCFQPWACSRSRQTPHGIRRPRYPKPEPCFHASREPPCISSLAWTAPEELLQILETERPQMSLKLSKHASLTQRMRFAPRFPADSPLETNHSTHHPKHDFDSRNPFKNNALSGAHPAPLPRLVAERRMKKTLPFPEKSRFFHHPP